MTSHGLVAVVQGQISYSKRKENFDINRFRVVHVNVPAPSTSIVLKNISGLNVIDARADTVSVGFMQKRIYALSTGFSTNAAWNQAEPTANKTPTFVRVRNGFGKETESFGTRYLAFNQNDSLPSILMVIKRFWLSDELNVKDNQRAAVQMKETGNRGMATSGVDVQIEFFLKDNVNYFPLYRFDSIISERKIISAHAADYIAQALALSLQKMRFMDERIAFVQTKRSFTLEEVMTHLQNEFKLPVLTDSVLRKGVYMTFNEFKTNQPSLTDFEVRKDKLTDNIYIKQPGDSQFAARNIWGYCDGENAFVKSVNNFFILQRFQNAFYIYGAKSIIMDDYQSTAAGGYYSNSSGAVIPVTFNGANTRIQLEPFQLDWNTGKLY